MRPNNNLVLNNLTTGATQNSPPQWAWDIVRASFQAVVTGTATGSIKVQVSNDQSYGLPANQFVPLNWTDIGTPVAIAAAGVFLIPLFETSYEYIRLVYVDTSGGVATGKITARMHSKGL